MLPSLALLTVMVAQLARPSRSVSRRRGCLPPLLIAGAVVLCGVFLLAAFLLVLLGLKGGVW